MAARDRFLECGYAATTVDHICKAAGVTKGAFFHHFDTKEAMAREVLDRFIEGLFAPMGFARDPRLEGDPLKRIRTMFDQLASAYGGASSGTGCLIGLFVMELGALNTDFRAVCAAAFEKLRDALERELSAATRYHSSQAADLGVLADGAVSAIQGAVIVARARKDTTHLRSALAGYAQLLETTILSSAARGEP